MPQTLKQERALFVETIVVPYETIKKLDRYAELLAEWNQKFNLVASSTLPHVWTRHFLDSAQLSRHIPKDAETIADMGSGAGFPGIVLALLNPEKTVTLIEATGKKANFLRTVITELGLTNTIVRQERVEDMRDLEADIVTARALKPLPELLDLAEGLLKKYGSCLFLKGKNADVELTEAEKSWTFKAETFPSLTDPCGKLLILRKPKSKNAAAHTYRK